MQEAISLILGGLTIDSAYIVRWDATQDNFVPVSGAGGAPLK